jgi:hypothetical protein
LFQLTNAPSTATFAAFTDHRRKKNIAFGTLLAAIASTIQAIRAHQWRISPRPNYSSIPQSVPPGPNSLVIDLANFYLNTPMPNLEYMHLHLDIIPNKTIVHYNLHDIVTLDD